MVRAMHPIAMYIRRSWMVTEPANGTASLLPLVFVAHCVSWLFENMPNPGKELYLLMLLL